MAVFSSVYGRARVALCLAPLVLAACVSTASAPQASRTTPARDLLPLPPARGFAPAPAVPPQRSNQQMAQDFLDLSFALESGRALDVMTRFEGPITLRVIGTADPNLERELGALLERLRREADVSITRVQPGAPAAITIQAMPQADLQRYVPDAACFVVPRVADWDGYRRERNSELTDWTTLTQRNQVAIFVPAGAAPQELRDCLHEELAQALGPLNDLYRLPDSTFNDDNFHTVLTGFDMLMLRVTYAPELRSGMDRAMVAARLPGILDRLNPGGRGIGNAPAGVVSGLWQETVKIALNPRAGASRRLDAARRAVDLSQTAEASRRGFSLFLRGRLNLSRDRDVALASFLAAEKIYANDPNTRLQSAHVAMQLAAFDLVAQNADAALARVAASEPIARRAQNAALLASLLAVKSAALALKGQSDAAEAAEREGLAYARFGFGAEPVVRARMSEIAQLALP